MDQERLAELIYTAWHAQGFTRTMDELCGEWTKLKSSTQEIYRKGARMVLKLASRSGWVEVDLPFFSSLGDDGKESPSFKNSGLCKAGTLIKFGDGDVVLIGHINEAAGSCDHCRSRHRDDVVKAYKVIWKEGEDDDDRAVQI